MLKFDKIYRTQDTNLQMWKEEIENIKANDIFVYFSNYYEGHAPTSVNKLMELFAQELIKPETLERQNSLF